MARDSGGIAVSRRKPGLNVAFRSRPLAAWFSDLGWRGAHKGTGHGPGGALMPTNLRKERRSSSPRAEIPLQLQTGNCRLVEAKRPGPFGIRTRHRPARPERFGYWPSGTFDGLGLAQQRRRGSVTEGRAVPFADSDRQVIAGAALLGLSVALAGDTGKNAATAGKASTPLTGGPARTLAPRSRWFSSVLDLASRDCEKWLPLAALFAKKTKEKKRVIRRRASLPRPGGCGILGIKNCFRMRMGS